jgi:ElaB/YqjD/DUF883 family membrane-anchored ribosome-binding protein
MSTNDSNQQLMKDLQTVISEAESLLQSAIAPASEEFKSARQKFEATVKNAKGEILRLEQAVEDKAREAANATDGYVRENPWQAVGLGAAVGLIVGLLIARK